MRQELNKHVLILYPAYWEQAMGGAEIQIKYLVEFLVKNNYLVSFVFEDIGIKYTNSLGINLIPLKRVKIKKRFGSKWIFFHKKINRILNEIEPDIIYTRFYSSWSGIASVYANQSNKVHIWALASDKDIAQKKNSLIRPFDWIEKHWVNKAFKYANTIVTQNKLQQLMLKQNFHRDGFFFPQSALMDNSITINKSTSKIMVCWIANLKPLKRPELFLKLVDLMKGDLRIEFVMIGRPHKGYMEMIFETESNNSNFRYLGELSNEKVNEVLASSHILVNTSDYEGFSNTFIQAWLRKVVVISFNSNPDEILTNKGLGYVSNDLNTVKEILINILDNKFILIKKGEKSFNYSFENHLFEKNIERLLKLF